MDLEEAPQVIDYRIPNFEIYSSNPVAESITELKRQAYRLSKKARIWGQFYKCIDVVGSVTIILLTAGIAFLSLGQSYNDEDGDQASRYASGILALVIGAIESAKRIFSFNDRGNVFKGIANRSFHVGQRTQVLCNRGYSEEMIMKKIDDYYVKLGNLDMSLYDSSALTLYNSNRSGTNATLSGLGSVPQNNGLNLGPPNS